MLTFGARCVSPTARSTDSIWERYLGGCAQTVVPRANQHSRLSILRSAYSNYLANRKCG